MSKQFGFPATRRLSGRTAFARVFGGRCSAGNKLLVVYVRFNGLEYSRLGLSVGRRCGSAVRRVRLKRLLREAFRLEAASLPAGFDIVCIPQPSDRASLETYRRALQSIVPRAVERCPRSEPRS